MKKPFTVKFIGKIYSVDSEKDFRGADETLGNFPTFKLAFNAAVTDAVGGTVIQIHDRDSETNPIFTCDGEYPRQLKNPYSL